MRRILFALTALILVASACGGSDDNGPVLSGTAVPGTSVADGTTSTTDEPGTMAEPSDNANSADDTATGEAEIAGVTVIGVADVQHIDGDVDYDIHPPAGGDHNPGWQNCGFYTVEVPEAQAVHSLEHGAVWVTHTDAATEADLALLDVKTASEGHLLISPYANQDTTFVLTAWGRQVGIDSLTDPMFELFLATYMGDGPTAPEPLAPCDQAYGIPPLDPLTIK